MQKIEKYPDYEFAKNGWPTRVSASSKGRKATTGKLEPQLTRNDVPYFQLKTDKGTYQLTSLRALHALVNPVSVIHESTPIPNFSEYSFDESRNTVFSEKTNKHLKPFGKGYFRLVDDNGETHTITIGTIKKLIGDADYALSDMAAFFPTCPEYRFDQVTAKVWRVMKNGEMLRVPIPLMPDKYNCYTLIAEEGSALANIQCYMRDEIDEIIRFREEAPPIILPDGREIPDMYLYRTSPCAVIWAREGKLRVRATEEAIDRLTRALNHYPDIYIE